MGISVFGICPRIKGLVNEHNALLIGNFNEFRRGGVVGDANGVAAHLLENLHLPLDGAIPGLRAKRPLVVVHTDAFELGGLAVEFKAIGAVKICPTEAELGLAGVYHRITHQNFRLQRIESGRIRRPEGGILNLGSLRNVGRCSSGNLNCSLGSSCGSGNLRALLVNSLLDGHRCWLGRGVFHHRLNVHGAVFATGSSQVGRGHIDAALGHVHRIGDGEVYRAVDAAAGVPAAGGRLVFHFHSNDVFALKIELVLGQLERERRIAIGMEAQLFAIEIDRGIHIDAAKVNGDVLPLPLRGQGEGFAVPACAAGQVAAFRFTAGGVALLDAIVMGQIHVAPGRIIIGRICAARAQIEAPVVAEVHLAGTSAVGIDVNCLLRRGGLRLGGARLSCGECLWNKSQDHHQCKQHCGEPFGAFENICISHSLPPSFVGISMASRLQYLLHRRLKRDSRFAFNHKKYRLQTAPKNKHGFPIHDWSKAVQQSGYA